MPKTLSKHAPKDLAHGDRVTITDPSGNELTGLLKREQNDNGLEVTLSITAFGKQIRVAVWKADSRRWTSFFPVIGKELTLW